MFRLIKKRSFDLLCVLDFFFRTLAVNSVSDFSYSPRLQLIVRLVLLVACLYLHSLPHSINALLHASVSYLLLCLHLLWLTPVPALLKRRELIIPVFFQTQSFPV